MNEVELLFQEIFFAVFESLPRQGPGSRACAERALSLCHELPPSPAVLDLGCGTGAQTLQLSELTGGSITAIDSHAPSIERLRARLMQRGLSDRVHTLVGDFASWPWKAGSFDLVWSEGALYNMGLANAVQMCKRILCERGYLAFTEPVWLEEDIPAALRESFESDYPTMGSVGDALAILERSGLTVEGHFPLPGEAWLDEFYVPMEKRLIELRRAYEGNTPVLAALDQIAREPQMHRHHSHCYAYEFFVARKP